MRSLLVVLLTVGVGSGVLGVELPWMDTLSRDLTHYVEGGAPSSNLRTALDLLTVRTPLVGRARYQDVDIKLFDIVPKEDRGFITCQLCRTFLDAAFGWVESGMTLEELITRLSNLCVELGIGGMNVCRGSIEVNTETMLYIVQAKNNTPEELTPAQMCGFALYPDCNLNAAQFQWTLDLDFLGPKPAPENPQLPPEGSPTMKILQITDVHIDPLYTPGNDAECGDPVCCRLENGPAANASAEAGYWGDYRNCDAPVHQFTDLLAEAAARHQDVGYVIFTGDIIDHAVWSTSAQYNTEQITLVRDLLAQYFPGVPVIPIVGNHEAHPCNVFADPLHTEIPSHLDSTWLYQLIADLWSTWLPPSTVPDILSGGMFSYEVKPGLVVIGINTMFCYSYNWWLMYDNVDPAGELIWMANQLLAAEQAGKKAHILAHHPSGKSDCMHFWTYQYRRIIDRFENTVVAQFHGHTHNDHFHVFYDLADSSRPTAVAFTAGSGTPYTNINPNYRVYTVDGDYPGSQFRVLDHETWNFNLTEANLGGSSVAPAWKKMYSFNEAYSTPSQFPADMDALVWRMRDDPLLQDQYWRYYVKEGDASLENGCNTNCLEDLVCKIVTTVVDDNSKCKELYP